MHLYFQTSNAKLCVFPADCKTKCQPISVERGERTCMAKVVERSECCEMSEPEHEIVDSPHLKPERDRYQT